MNGRSLGTPCPLFHVLPSQVASNACLHLHKLLLIFSSHPTQVHVSVAPLQVPTPMLST